MVILERWFVREYPIGSLDSADAPNACVDRRYRRADLHRNTFAVQPPNATLEEKGALPALGQQALRIACDEGLYWVGYGHEGSRIAERGGSEWF